MFLIFINKEVFKVLVKSVAKSKSSYTKPS